MVVKELPRSAVGICQRCRNSYFNVEQHKFGYSITCIICGDSREMNFDLKMSYSEENIVEMDGKHGGRSDNVDTSIPWGVCVTKVQLYLVDKGVHVSHLQKTWSGGVTPHDVYIYHIPTMMPIYKWNDKFTKRLSTYPTKWQIFAVEMSPMPVCLDVYTDATISALRELIRKKLCEATGIDVRKSPIWEIWPLGEVI